MQPKFTQRNAGFFVRILALTCVLIAMSQVSFAQRKDALWQATSVGPAPVNPEFIGDDIFPTAGNPVSRAWCYNTPGAASRLNSQSLLNTTLTPIGATVSFGFPGAAAWVTTTNKMYVVDQASPFPLYIVDTLTGARTFVANCTGVPQANLTGLTWDPSSNVMYGASTSITASSIFTINITTGVCTPIGSPTTVAPGVILLNAAPGGSLFATDIVNDALYRFNKTTGVPTLVGPLGFDANFGQDGHFDFSDGQYFIACYNNTAGQAQLRIVDTLTGSSTLVGPYGGQVTTLAIYTPPQPPCAGTPNPGNTLANVTFACPSVPVNLSLQNTTPGSSVTYQWQKAAVLAGPVPGTFANIAGANSPSYSALQTVPTYYRCIVTCTPSATSGTSVPVLVDQNPFYNCYCANAPSSNADEDLFNITLGTLNNSSTCATTAPGPGSIKNRYSNYKTLAPSTLVTGNLPISIQIGTCGGNWPNGAVAWIDFNQNGVFDHPAERIYYEPSTTTGPHTANGIAVIPSSATFGVTGMRVIAVENIGGPTPINMTPCTAYIWGETEDYLVNVQPCVPLPVSGITAPATVTGECSGIVAIPVNTGTASFPTFQWEYRVNASSPWVIAVDGGLGGVITGATTGTLVLINVPSSLSGYQFRAIASNPCSAIDFSAPPTTVTINPLVARVSPTSATICRGQLQQLQLASPQASFSSGPMALSIPDGVPLGVITNLPVSGIPTSATITEIRVTFNMTHTYVGDMSVNLRAPNGQTINLFALLDGGTGSNGSANFVNTSISSDNTRPALSGAPAPRTGVYRADRYGTVLNAAPFGPTILPVTTQVWTGLMNAATINGTWTLGLADLGAIDQGVLQNWTITISYGAPITGIWSQSPAPAPPNQFAGMWTDAGGTVAYTGGAASTIWVNPTSNAVYSVIASTVTPPCTSAPTQIPVNVTQPLTALSTVANKSVCTGSNTSFSVTATSPAGSPYDGPFTYQWQESRDNGLTWQNVSNGGVYAGATTNTLTLTGVTRSAPSDMNLYRYRVNVNAAACGTALTSNTALLTVFALPAVTITATDLALTPGSTSILTATSSPAALSATSWSWTRNGSTITGVSTNSVTADVDKLGVYRATVTDVNGCRNSSNSLLIESEVSDRLWIYPNPTTGKFQVRWYYSGVYTEIRRVRIYNAAGQQIASRDWPLSNITPRYLQMDLSLQGLSGGIYVIQVSDLYDKKHVQGLLIKQ